MVTYSTDWFSTLPFTEQPVSLSHKDGGKQVLGIKGAKLSGSKGVGHGRAIEAPSPGLRTVV
jgi:hypothetical protein